MKQLLFQEFQEVSAKQWKQKIQADLKGADYNDKLITQSLHGVAIKPFYTSEDLEEPIKVKSTKDWSICERIYGANTQLANQKAKHALAKGAESLWIIIPDDNTDPESLFSGLQDAKVIYLETEFLNADYIQKLNDFFKGKNHKVYLQTDIIGNLARSGNWFDNLKEDHLHLDQIMEHAEAFNSALSVDATLYQNAGANIPQQLAYALAHANEYLNHLTSSEILKNKKTFSVQFKIATGSNYFFEIAKIRALRWLYASLATEYGLNEICHILSLPSKRNKTLYDYNVNMLRTTTESMSAILGGADAIYNLPYDAIYHKNNEFGDRIARNQLLIMKNESYLDKVGNIAEGTYYIEELTRQFAEKALKIFKEIENGGGFLTQLKEGIIQRKIEESAKKEQDKFNNEELILIGTNKFENHQDKMKQELELYPFLKQNPRKTLIQPILERRLSEKMEQERLEKESQKDA